MTKWNQVSQLVALCGTASAIGAGCNLFGGSHGDAPAPQAVLSDNGTPTLSLGPVVTLASPPPPISGGTLTIAPDGTTAVAADPDRDRIYIVDLTARSLSRTVQLAPNDEPGRVAIDAEGRAHVVLRGANALLTLTLASGSTLRRPTCVAPRGVAIDKAQDSVVVACSDGHMMRFPAAGGAATADVTIEPDLRDVVVRQDGTLAVTTFRNAAFISLDAKLAVMARSDPQGVKNIAWRMFEAPNNGGHPSTVMISQKPLPPAPTGPAYYTPDNPCGLVPTHVDLFGGDAEGASFDLHAVLPVDAAADDHSIAVLSAGNGHAPGAPHVYLQSRPASPSTGGGTTGAAGPAAPSDPTDPSNAGCSLATDGTALTTPGQPIAIAIDGASELIVQSREPAALYIFGPDRSRVMHTIKLADDSREDTGHAIFHSNSSANVACASCHAEGGEDGHVWSFGDVGDRRTPSLRGTISGTAPYHWDGSQKDMTDIMATVFEERMSGPTLDPSQIEATRSWVFSIPAPPPLHGATAASTRGAALFTTSGCTGCHSGAKHTNNQSVDVGTGGTFQVPSLVGVAWRAPYAHDGRFANLTERFTDGGSQHGNVKDLTPAQIQDLIAFLETF